MSEADAMIKAESAALRVEEPVREVLAFEINDERYALPLGSIREILKVPPITPVPRAPRAVLGIISVRGKMTTLLDLRRLLTVPERRQTKATRVLLVDTGEEVMGVLIDRVMHVIRLKESEVEPAAVVGSELSEHVFGIGRPKARAKSETDADDILILLDPIPLLRRW